MTDINRRSMLENSQNQNWNWKWNWESKLKKWCINSQNNNKKDWHGVGSNNSVK